VWPSGPTHSARLYILDFVRIAKYQKACFWAMHIRECTALWFQLWGPYVKWNATPYRGPCEYVSPSAFPFPVIYPSHVF